MSFYSKNCIFFQTISFRLKVSPNFDICIYVNQITMFFFQVVLFFAKSKQLKDEAYRF